MCVDERFYILLSVSVIGTYFNDAEVTLVVVLPLPGLVLNRPRNLSYLP